MGRVTTGVLLWLVAAVAATAVGMTAVAAIGTDIFGGGQDPLTQSEVEALLASSTVTAPPTTSTTTPTTTPTPTTSSPPPTPEGQPVASEGGTVTAACVPGGVQVLSTVPAQGYQVDQDDDEIDDHPSVKFQSGEREVEIRLRCVDGQVTSEVRYDD